MNNKYICERGLTNRGEDSAGYKKNQVYVQRVFSSPLLLNPIPPPLRSALVRRTAPRPGGADRGRACSVAGDATDRYRRSRRTPTLSCRASRLLPQPRCRPRRRSTAGRERTARHGRAAGVSRLPMAAPPLPCFRVPAAFFHAQPQRATTLPSLGAAASGAAGRRVAGDGTRARGASCRNRRGQGRGAGAPRDSLCAAAARRRGGTRGAGPRRHTRVC